MNLLFLLRTPRKAQTKHRKPHCLVRTPSTAEQPSIGPAQGIRVHTAVLRRVDQSLTTQSKHSEQACTGIYERVRILFIFFPSSLFLICLYVKKKANNKNLDIFPSTDDTGDGPSLDYPIFCVDIDVTDVAKNSRLLLSLQPHGPRCCLLCVLKLFPSIDIQQALVQHTQCQCRFAILRIIL